MRENPDLTAFLTLDLKTWVDRKIIFEDILIDEDDNPKELLVIVSKVLVGKYTDVGEETEKGIPYFKINDQGEKVLVMK